MKGMFSTTATVFALLLLNTAWLSGHASAGSQYVVVAVDPPAETYSPGTVLNVDDTIDIPEGTIVTLLGEDGSVNAIPGPAQITVTAESVETVGAGDDQKRDEKRSTLSKIAGLLSGEKKNADSLGVARSFSGRPKPQGLDDPWAISIHGDSEGCVKGEPVRLARNSFTETLSVSLEGDRDSKPVEMTWREGEAELELPPALALTNGELFIKAGQQRALIRLHTLPTGINQQNPVDVLGWMIESGCARQAVAFTRQLAIDAQ